MAAALALGVASNAEAMGGIATSPPGASAITDIRVAVASDGLHTTRWASLHVKGTATEVAWIIPVHPGASADLASDAWLESLEAATAPRVESPDVTPPCGIPGGVDVVGDLTHVTTAVPSASAVAPDRATVEGILTGWGIVLTPDLGAEIDAAVANGEELLVLRYDTNGWDVTTRAVRIVDESAPTAPMSFTNAGAASVNVTAYAVGPSRAAIGSAAPVALAPNAVLWNDDGTSTYASARDALLVPAPGAWLVEVASHAPLFAGATVAGGFDVAPLYQTYFARAASYGDTTGDPSTCVAKAAANAQSGLPVGVACPRGALAQLDVDAGCEETPTPSELAPDAFRCGGSSDDLALALAGLAPGAAWVTRAASVIAPSTAGTDVPVQSLAGGDIEPVMTAAGYADSACTTPTPDPEPVPVGGNGNGSGGRGTGGGSGNTTPSGGGALTTSGSPVTTPVVVSSGDSCGGDTTDSSDDGSDSSGCDSSSSSDGGDSGGDDCSGASDAGSGADDCATAPSSGHGHGHGRSAMSRVALLVTFLAFVSRRGRGRKRAS